jgi:hypothetical protein
MKRRRTLLLIAAFIVAAMIELRADNGVDLKPGAVFRDCPVCPEMAVKWKLVSEPYQCL